MFYLLFSNEAFLNCCECLYSFLFVLLTRLPRESVVKHSPANLRDSGLIPWSERTPGEGNVNSLQYSCLENPMDRGSWDPLWGHEELNMNEQLNSNFFFTLKDNVIFLKGAFVAGGMFGCLSNLNN